MILFPYTRRDPGTLIQLPPGVEESRMAVFKMKDFLVRTITAKRTPRGVAVRVRYYMEPKPPCEEPKCSVSSLGKRRGGINGATRTFIFADSNDYIYVIWERSTEKKFPNGPLELTELDKCGLAFYSRPPMDASFEKER